jgi:uncharacterized protein (DUF433 family)
MMDLNDYRYLAVDPEMLCGQPYVKGTRLSAAFILSCLAEGMTVKEISESYVPVPAGAVAEVLKLAAEVLDAGSLAA